MPYIVPEKRYLMKEIINCLFSIDRDAGQLNYIISRICHKYILQASKVNYSLLNEVIGVLECAKQELLRTVIGPYEENKRLENGPVSELDKMEK